MSATCSFRGCPNGVEARGYCHSHYSQLHRGKPLTALKKRVTPEDKKQACTFPECQRATYALNLCTGHYERQRRGLPLSPLRLQTRSTDHPAVCKAGDCGNPSRTMGMCGRHYSVTRRYNVSISWYLERLERGCEICGETTGKMHVDHDHRCCLNGSCGNCVRGILCHGCNVALGFMGDNVKALESAVTYLRKHSG